MTAVNVIDASALAAILFGEPEADDVARRIDGSQLVAPQLLSYELANICLKKVRRDPAQAALFKAGLRALHAQQIIELPVDHDDVLALAIETKLTAYDASYLWLALQVEADLVTLDAALDRAWKAKVRTAP